MIDAKPFRITFDRIEGFIRVYIWTRYLVLFVSEKYDFIYNRNIYLIEVKKGIIYIISNNYAKIKVVLYDPLPLEKIMTFNNLIILIKSVFNKNKNNIIKIIYS